MEVDTSFLLLLDLDCLAVVVEEVDTIGARTRLRVRDASVSFFFLLLLYDVVISSALS